MTHTALPWVSKGSQIHGPNEEIVVGGNYGENRKFDTPFIICACNAHEELVNALLQCKLFLENCTYDDSTTYSMVVSALAKAEGKL